MMRNKDYGSEFTKQHFMSLFQCIAENKSTKTGENFRILLLCTKQPKLIKSLYQKSKYVLSGLSVPNKQLNLKQIS